MFRPAPEPVFWVRAVLLHILPRGLSAGGRAYCPVCRSAVLTACGLHASVRMAAPPHSPLPNLNQEFLETRQHSVCPRLSWSTQLVCGRWEALHEAHRTTPSVPINAHLLSTNCLQMALF